MFILVWLAVLLSHIILGQKNKIKMKSIYFQKIVALKKLKQTQNTKNRLKSFKIDANRNPKNVLKTKIDSKCPLPNMRKLMDNNDNNCADTFSKNYADIDM